jgi:hypothetical protein
MLSESTNVSDELSFNTSHKQVISSGLVSNPELKEPDLDFAVIGFPKTGTTFLLQALSMHPEITMPSKEYCELHLSDGDKQLVNWIKNQSALHPSGQKYGIKCPNIVKVTNAIDNMMKVSDQTRLVVGVRHPVLWFQSLYNYR